MDSIELTEEDLRNMNTELLIKMYLNQQENTKQLKKAVEELTEQIRILNQRHFGRKTESSHSVDQLQMDLGFNDAEAEQDPDVPEPAAEEAVTRRKKKTQSKEDKLKKILNVREEYVELPEEELNQRFGVNGWKRLPYQQITKVEHHPATFELVTYNIGVYAAKNNDGEIARTEKPAEMFEKSICTPSLLASIIHAKYVNAVPLYRQEAVYQANDVNLSRATMANWIIRSADMYFETYVNALKKELVNKKVVHADETPVLVTKDGRKAGSKSYMWVYRTSEKKDIPPIVIYDYQRTRSSQRPAEFLKGFKGTVVCDGYEGYHALERRTEDLKVAGCWVHLKRKFADVVKAADKKKSYPLAEEAVKRISNIFHADNQLNEEEKLKGRQEKVKPMVDSFFVWVRESQVKVDSSSGTGEGFKYALNQEKYLRTFLEDADVPMDNNAAERAIRPFTIGRKNWVMIDTINGANASAALYSIVETGRANNLNLYQYIKYLLEELPLHLHGTDTEIPEKLMPWSEELPAYIRKGSGTEPVRNNEAAI